MEGSAEILRLLRSELEQCCVSADIITVIVLGEII